MPTRRPRRDPKPDHQAERTQPPLIPLSAEELRDAGRSLALKIRELEEMEADHAEQRKVLKADRGKLRGKIAAIASTIRSQGR